MSDDLELTFDDNPVSTKPCPECNGDMELRRNMATGIKFWGCCSYPECECTQPINDGSFYGYSPYGEDEDEDAEWRNFEVF